MNNEFLYKAKKHKKVNIHKSLFVIRMLAIALINIAVFYFYVNFKSIMMAFKIDGEDGFTFYHFATFLKDIAKADSTLFKALINTFIFFGTSVFIIFPLSLVISYFIYKSFNVPKVYPISSHLVSSSSRIEAFVEEVLWSSTMAPG